MGYGFAYDGPPTKCAKGPRSGTVALRAGVMERFGCGDQGIFNCRPIRTRGSTTLSFHADGRAWDAKCTGELNKRIAAWLVQWADILGIQEVISYRRRWDSKTRQWRVYNGDDDHTGHVHTTQCIRAANTLTLATVRAIEDGAPGPITPPPQEDDMTPEQYEGIVKEIRAVGVKNDALDRRLSVIDRIVSEIHPDADAARIAAQQALDVADDIKTAVDKIKAGDGASAEEILDELYERLKG